MIHQNDILLFTSVVDAGDDRCVMLAMEDEYQREGTPNQVKVRELNDWTPLGSVRVLEADTLRVAGQVLAGDTKESIVRRILPEDKWEFTRELYKKNKIVRQ